MIPGLKSATADIASRLPAPRVAPVRTEAVGLLAAGLAHDLNNMLGGIVATAELVQDRVSRNGEDRRDLQAIIEQAVKASGLVRQILAFSRQDMLNPVMGDLARMLEAITSPLAPMLGAAIRLELRREAQVNVTIDPTALDRAVVNLVLNARDALGTGGLIRITAARVGPANRPDSARSFMPPIVYGAVAVEDDGPGVDPAIAARIFEPYFTTRRAGQGLGLSSAYGLVKQSGGYLLLDRSVLGGARFTIYLPEAGRSHEYARAAQVRGGQTILLVEDDLLLRMSAARGLERQGYRVRQAADGEAAMARMGAERPSLLLSDIRMPGLDGIELARRARTLHPGLPILLVSGYADEGERAAVPELDVGFLQKPFTLKTLGERIRELV